MRVNCNKDGIERAVRIINKGGIAIFPTDTIYGIGCDPYNDKSVKKIYDIKSRETSKPFPVLVYSKKIAEKFVYFDDLSTKIVERFWPGPLTIIVNSKDKKLNDSLNISNKIAIRVPNHKCTLELLKECNLLIGTSANLSGHSGFTDPNECFDNIQDYDIFVDGGAITSNGESTIIEVENKNIKIIREGAISRREIFSI